MSEDDDSDLSDRTTRPDPGPGSGPDEPPPDGSGERYEIADRLGRGGMAVVQEARDLRLGRLVALKCLHPHLADDGQARDRFFDEARLLASLDHPGLVAVHDAGRFEDGQPFYAMQRVRGRTLRELLDDRQPRDLRGRSSIMRFVDVFERVCQSVAAAHDASIIHRDLKPANVMVDTLGRVYVMDWGLGKRLESGPEVEDSSRTRDGAVFGSPAYMSPEQADGRSLESDRQSDVFSLGVMLYEILTGDNPFRGRDYRETLRGVLYHDPEDPRRKNPRVPRALAGICLKALSKDPFLRYATAGELADEIRRFREFRPVHAVRQPIYERFGNWARRHAVLATLAGVVLLAGGVFLLNELLERRMIADAYSRLDLRLADLEGFQDATAEVERRLAALPPDDPGRPVLERRLAELRVRSEVALGLARGTAFAVTGMTLFAGSGDPRARDLLRGDFLGIIEDAASRGDWVRVEALCEFMLELHGRANPMNLGEPEAEQVRSWLSRALEEEAGP